MKEINTDKSSNIKSISHDGENLTVIFRSGGVYIYEGVSEEVFNRFCEAESFGKFFLKEIKGNYPYKK